MDAFYCFLFLRGASFPPSFRLWLLFFTAGFFSARESLSVSSVFGACGVLASVSCVIVVGILVAKGSSSVLIVVGVCGVLAFVSLVIDDGTLVARGSSSVLSEVGVCGALASVFCGSVPCCWLS